MKSDSNCLPLHIEPLRVVRAERTGKSPMGTGVLSLGRGSSLALAPLQALTLPGSLRGSGRSWRKGPVRSGSGQASVPAGPMRLCSYPGPTQKQVGEAQAASGALSSEPQCRRSVSSPTKPGLTRSPLYGKSLLKTRGHDGRHEPTTASFCAHVRSPHLRKCLLSPQPIQRLG